MTKQSLAKEKIFQAALMVFNTKGYSGTSVRDIATIAKVNVSTISYYFDGKEGLLKHCFITFFEPYIQIVEDGYKQFQNQTAKASLQNMLNQLMDYQYKHYALARFVWREVSVDSQIVREMMSTYFRKERYYLQSIIEKGIKHQEFRKTSVGIAIIQLKGMITMPFLHSIYTSEVWNVYFQEQFYFEKYKEQLQQWIEHYLCTSTKELIAEIAL